MANQLKYSTESWLPTEPRKQQPEHSSCQCYYSCSYADNHLLDIEQSHTSAAAAHYCGMTHMFTQVPLNNTALVASKDGQYSTSAAV
jgi:hypothetical protein